MKIKAENKNGKFLYFDIPDEDILKTELSFFKTRTILYLTENGQKIWDNAQEEVRKK